MKGSGTLQNSYRPGSGSRRPKTYGSGSGTLVCYQTSRTNV